MKLIAISTNKYTQDTHFIVDNEDYEKVSKFKWRLGINKYGYISIARTAKKSEKDAGSPHKIYLSRFVLGIHLRYSLPNEEVDHINRNTLDNRKSNLRICNRRVNQRNKANNTRVGFGLWGATFNKIHKYKNWQANFHLKGKTYMCGRFNTEIEAHNAAVEKYKEITGKNPVI